MRDIVISSRVMIGFNRTKKKFTDRKHKEKQSGSYLPFSTDIQHHITDKIPV